MKLPLFPLPICLLPEGFTQLRIFEPRYKRLVAESLKSAEGFGLCMTSEDGKQILPIGTIVHIIDFETLADGMLGVSIQGGQRFTFSDVMIESDGLKRAEVSPLENWPACPIKAKDRYLSRMLQNILEEYPKHLQHFDVNKFEDISWVCQRWLEILPVRQEEKYTCINSLDHQLTLALLGDMMKEES
ncbi:LON peptidase substrate-binding domain-containing protein [Shewanella acanthi]|uniref:LON peptidase substrate-binding domain-containing protein n=1 Tax=Shewanella acanthi TaxID=2864212 RepID=UPI001C65EAE7|nr:LON peptidase substrate-binding domain-containing protein [Shewanella acanthi]QYJ77554.1 LON peptidase substrate-binding domain-containing protein [Shewanella acanthi]